MKFIDECTIKVCGGRGGKGAADFLKQFPSIPSGGNGGPGGSVYLKSDIKENTLLNICSKGLYIASDGGPGGYQNSNGAKAEDLLLNVPLGTKVFLNKKMVAEVKDEKPVLVAKGGRGGRGNKTLTIKGQDGKNHNFEKGHPGEELNIRLELDVLADVGFVGKPSAGKSTILSVISNAKPKIASYDFTTLEPQLGLVRVNKNNSFVAVDLPGLIARETVRNQIEEDTLKIISKCKSIAYVLDFGDERKSPIKDFEELKKELKGYSQKLEDLPIVIIANKMDMPNFYNQLKLFTNKNPNMNIVMISALEKKNIKDLKYRLLNVL